MTEPTDKEQYLNIADQCAATATSDLAASILVDGGNGTLRQLLNDAADAIRAGWATPQPTQAQAGAVPMYRLLQSGVDRIEAADEFLSDDTTTWAIDPNGIFVGNIYGGHVLRPARRRIKGGQHGTDN